MEPLTASPRCVLVLDRDPSVRNPIAAVLRRQGYLVESHDSANEALRSGDAGRYHAIIIEPRDLGGETVLGELHAAGGGRRNLIVVTDADSSPVPYHRARGVRRVLLKPFYIDELAQEVARCCEG